MAKYPFTELQARFMRGLAPCLENGSIGSHWIIARNDDGFVILDLAKTTTDDECPDAARKLLQSLDYPDLDDLEGYGFVRAIEHYKEYSVNKGLWLAAVANELAEPDYADRRNQQINVGTAINSQIGIGSVFSQIHNNIGASQQLTQEDKAALDQLFSQLEQQLNAASPGHDEEIEVLAYTADELVNHLSKPKHNPLLLRKLVDDLGKAASGIKDIVLPAAATVAAIVTLLKTALHLP